MSNLLTFLLQIISKSLLALSGNAIPEVTYVVLDQALNPLVYSLSFGERILKISRSLAKMCF